MPRVAIEASSRAILQSLRIKQPSSTCMQLFVLVLYVLLRALPTNIAVAGLKLARIKIKRPIQTSLCLMCWANVKLMCVRWQQAYFDTIEQATSTRAAHLDLQNSAEKLKVRSIYVIRMH